jgi:hypothetical protein
MSRQQPSTPLSELLCGPQHAALLPCETLFLTCRHGSYMYHCEARQQIEVKSTNAPCSRAPKVEYLRWWAVLQLKEMLKPCGRPIRGWSDRGHTFGLWTSRDGFSLKPNRPSRFLESWAYQNPHTLHSYHKTSFTYAKSTTQKSALEDETIVVWPRTKLNFRHTQAVHLS